MFRPDDVIDEATYDEPKTEASGIDMVVVNGQIALESGQHSGVGSGQMLRYRRPRSVINLRLLASHLKTLSCGRCRET